MEGKECFMILMCCNANGESQPTIKQQDYKKNDKVDCMNYYAHTKDNEPKINGNVFQSTRITQLK